MAWVAVDKNGDECIYESKPFRNCTNRYWIPGLRYTKLPKGSIKKLIGRELTWDDEPVELKEEKE